MELLDGFEQQQDGAVVDGQRLGDIDAPFGAFGPTFEEGETIRIEQRATQRGQAKVLVLDTAEHGTEDGQQTRPRIPAALQNLVRFGAQLHAQGREGIVRLIALVAQEQQASLFSGEQEDQPHHHRQRGFVELGFLHAA
ncbi:hypothetical protein D3C71_1617180 [compost metagenome]